MKKVSLILSVVVMTIMMLSSCGGDSNSSKATEKADSDGYIKPVNMDSACDYVSEASRIYDLMLAKVGNRMIEEISEDELQLLTELEEKILTLEELAEQRFEKDEINDCENLIYLQVKAKNLKLNLYPYIRYTYENGVEYENIEHVSFVIEDGALVEKVDSITKRKAEYLVHQ